MQPAAAVAAAAALLRHLDDNKSPPVSASDIHLCFYVQFSYRTVEGEFFFICVIFSRKHTLCDAAQLGTDLEPGAIKSTPELISA